MSWKASLAENKAMRIPVYVVTGFLCAGKTTFLNELLNRPSRRNIRTLLLQFESGEEAFHRRRANCTGRTITKKQLEAGRDKTAQAAASYIEETNPQEIWIEWNGMEPFYLLQELLLDHSLRLLCEIRKVLYITDEAVFEKMLKGTGSVQIGQAAESDVIIIRIPRQRADTLRTARIKRLAKSINPGVRVCLWESGDIAGICRQIKKEKDSGFFMFFMVLLFLSGGYYFAVPVFSSDALPINVWINVFTGILLQAIPFLLIGVLLSSAIQVCIPKAWIEKHFPKTFKGGMAAAVLGGFCLPVCDCASIPVFGSLVKKGVPLPSAVVFMLAAPVCNPVSILSTWYAFGGDLSVVAVRVGLGLVAAVLVGVSFIFCRTDKQMPEGGGMEEGVCFCCRSMDFGRVSSFKVWRLLKHAQTEFFDVAGYLVLGALVASVFQTFGLDFFRKLQEGAGASASTLLMMLVAFLLSLCSSSDAVVARSFAGQFPRMAVMGFLIFGPMMDIKNVMMLSSGFSRKFIVRLLFTVFIVCFFAVGIFYRWEGI